MHENRTGAGVSRGSRAGGSLTTPRLLRDDACSGSSALVDSLLLLAAVKGEARFPRKEWKWEWELKCLWPITKS